MLGRYSGFEAAWVYGCDLSMIKIKLNRGAYMSQSLLKNGTNDQNSAHEYACPVSAVDLIGLGEAVEALNEYVAPVLQNIHFAIAEHEGQTAVMVVNVETQKVMRYIPHQEVMAIGLSLERLRSLVARPA